MTVHIRGIEDRRNVLDRQSQRREEQVPDKGRHRHGQHDAPRNGAFRIDGLLGNARRCVVSGERPLRLQESDDEGPPVRPAFRVRRDWGKEESERLLRREHDERADNHGDADDVHGDAEVVETCDEPDTEMIDERMRQQDGRVDP